MIYIALFLIASLLFTLFGMLINFNKSKVSFQIKIDILENIIEELNNQLKNKHDKIKLSKELFEKIYTSNLMLNKSIYDLNVDVFSESFEKLK